MEQDLETMADAEELPIQVVQLFVQLTSPHVAEHCHEEKWKDKRITRMAPTGEK